METNQLEEGRGMKLFEFHYDFNNEEAFPAFYSDFMTMHTVIQLDCIQDAIYHLENLFEELQKKEQK